MKTKRFVSACLFSIIAATTMSPQTFASTLSKERMHEQMQLFKLTSAAEMEFMKGHHEEAMQMVNHAIDAYPQYGTGYLIRGSFHFKLDELDLALADFDKSIQVEPDFLPPYMQKAHTQGKLCRDTEARASLRQYIDKATPLGNLYAQDVANAKYELSTSRLPDEINCKVTH